jgi:hypothetical protein
MDREMETDKGIGHGHENENLSLNRISDCSDIGVKDPSSDNYSPISG